MSKFLSLDWFKEKIERSVEKVVEKKIEKLIDQLGDTDDPIIKEPVTKLYLNIKLVNNVLTVVLNNGQIISKSEATLEDYEKVKTCASIEEIAIAISNSSEDSLSEKRDIIKTKAIIEGIKLLADLDDFIVKDKSVYFKNTTRTLPPLLVEKFTTIVYNSGHPLEQCDLDIHEEYQSLKRFFLWCCLNPRAEVAEELYTFLTKNSFRITKQGFFVALRNVVTVSTDTDTELVKFISNAYNKIKAVWKKNPINYIVIKDASNEFALVKSLEGLSDYVEIGNLKDLYLDLPNMKENRFTDAHTRTFDIRIGRVVSMPKEKCNWNRADCGHAGLHFTADEIHYVGCGDTSVLVLINPMKVVGIGTSKGRCYEYLPIMTVPSEEATQILHDVDFDTLELDEQFTISELDDLTDKAQDGFVAETTKYQFNLPSISLVEINNIVSTLTDMKKEISKRISNID